MTNPLSRIGISPWVLLSCGDPDVIRQTVQKWKRTFASVMHPDVLGAGKEDGGVFQEVMSACAEIESADDSTLRKWLAEYSNKGSAHNYLEARDRSNAETVVHNLKREIQRLKSIHKNEKDLLSSQLAMRNLAIGNLIRMLSGESHGSREDSHVSLKCAEIVLLRTEGNPIRDRNDRNRIVSYTHTAIFIDRNYHVWQCVLSYKDQLYEGITKGLVKNKLYNIVKNSVINSVDKLLNNPKSSNWSLIGISVGTNVALPKESPRPAGYLDLSPGKHSLVVCSLKPSPTGSRNSLLEDIESLIQSSGKVGYHLRSVEYEIDSELHRPIFLFTPQE